MSEECKNLYRVCWLVKDTGAQGRGEPVSLDLATAWRDRENAKHLETIHWIEPVVGTPDGTRPTVHNG